MSETTPRPGRLPGDLTREQLVDRVIRVDQAGEYGAVRIYEGQLSVLGRTPAGGTTALICFILAIVTAAIPLGLATGLPAGPVIVGGLAVFGVVFALNSAVHSYLILDYTDGDKVALNVGFYYMANAGGRLIGCLLSGVLYQVAGLNGCLWGAFGFALAAAFMALALPKSN